jgi:hypothetical protein
MTGIVSHTFIHRICAKLFSIVPQGNFVAAAHEAGNQAALFLSTAIKILKINDLNC